MSNKIIPADEVDAWIKAVVAGFSRPVIPASGPPGNPEATPECDAVHDCDWIVYRCNYPADFDGGVAL